MYIKFCGFKRLVEVEVAVELGVNAIGFIHYPKSKRHVSIEEMKTLSQAIPSKIDRVAVLVNPKMALIDEILTQTSINTIQLHGNEEPGYIKDIKDKYPDVKIFKAIPASTKTSRIMRLYESLVDVFIIDTPSSQRGGTGETFKWSLVKAIKDTPFLLAGGINSDNVEQAKHISQCLIGFDLSSGIEVDGYKSQEKMEAFINTIKRSV
ncbi:phosphoribosylanthranilate isomerase [Staphylococcus massiliensis]|uniref:N-(5'-phosphoribosyl)anthranilate isomerase n=1 Tax=Staphylococcus massiliensis S46 TaxID=1229783 RepID=K9AID3_9STAP|nr:phosphoribosylanthranilate isomerase [Staphylococcus massiliensis]EKU47093.1 N-(5'-phosphoribosyl)anthranilate isomerase [Staphylococcus massiliensis S46]MCG3398614.1 phosphoribosylanthranilate isomerase [Staphylococcus massiliensis]MCG3401178.1 phosphoribosylanthranilate isomerase [Staphylococcus massiliensis]PNZ98530.1 phosphoribosylanthranilate isomerase [Staphylococcus massiliensis CCUG 55927]